MRKEILQEAEGYLARDRSRRKWKKVVGVLACGVVACTTYTLILPAITMEESQVTFEDGTGEMDEAQATLGEMPGEMNEAQATFEEMPGEMDEAQATFEEMPGEMDEAQGTLEETPGEPDGAQGAFEETPQCGKTEHTHSEACNPNPAVVSRTVPVCTPESLGLHRHTEECLDENGKYICGYADFVVHVHELSCYDEEGKLWCTLPEVKKHTHDENCYTQPEIQSPAHTHTEECYTWEPGELTCQLSEEPGHIHTEECYVDQDILICSIQESEGHWHNESCFDETGAVICGQEESEGHSHNAECYTTTRVLICPLSEEPGHQHTGDCYALNQVLTCPLSEEPVEASTERELICDKPEIILHEHTPECFDENSNLICGKTQVLEHVHNENCFQTVEEPADTEGITCELEEHTHSAACNVIGLIEKLPTQQSVEETMAAFEEAGDETGSNTYLAELQAQVKEAFEAYEALPEEEQAKVTNLARLTELEWVRSLTLQELPDVTVTNEDGTAASVASWTGDTTKAQEGLKATLLSIHPGYTIRSIGYYEISNLKGSKATVKYSDGNGLSVADANAKVFVYDLGTDGTTIQNCTVEEESVTKNEQAKLFTGFSFDIPEGNISEENGSHVYAFISASPGNLAEFGIYPGEKQENGTWVAIDGPTEGEANVKATVTLPENATAPDGYSLFIRKINDGEGFYPQEDAIKTETGKFNDWQCYTIRWIRVNENDELDMEPLNEIGITTVRIEYLKGDAKLKGPAGGRKLLIYNSNKDGSLVDQVAESVKNVQVDGDFYTSFTFEAAEAGPYVFVSKMLEKGFVEALRIGSIVDGSGPFDITDTPGNDSSTDNRIVRSYDTIQYNLEATFTARESGVTETAVNMYFDLNLGKSATAARFDVNKMLWLGDNYSIEYLDSQNNVIMIMAHDGKFYRPQKDENDNVRRDEHGFALASTEQVYLNYYLNGSMSEKDSYKVSVGAVTKQRLVGCTKVEANPGESILAGTQKFTMAVEVRNADNGEIFAPTFRMWLEGNEDNYGPEGQEGTEMLPAEPQNGNILDLSKEENQQYQVKVSAGTNFNVQLKKNDDMSYKNWFDFSSGNIVPESDRTELVRLASLEENHGKANPVEFTDQGKELDQGKKDRYANYRYGRITCYGITLQLYNDTDNPAADRANKHLKGLSLPVGDITFDLNFSSEATTKVEGQKLDQNQYTAILWDYNENIPANTSYSYTYKEPDRGKVTTPNDGKGNGGRNIYWDGESRSPYAKGAAPSNFKGYHEGCYYGGGWFMVDENGNNVAVDTVANPIRVTGTGKDTTYHFSVKDYDFDFDEQHFPVQDAGNTGKVEGYDTYALCFSAGCVQVLSVFPMVQKVSEAEIFLNTKVSNLRLKTRAGQVLKAQDDDVSKINHEVNTNDNIKRDQIVLYAPGKLTKGSAFNGTHNGKRPEATNQGFLGTEYWSTSYDCSAFAGDDIWITSYGMMASGSDFRTRSMNLLQLFDSYALSIRACPYVSPNYDLSHEDPGTATFLYAADPGCKEGYNTNEPGVLEYMNSVREEDLLYFTSLEDLEGAGYTCVGVLMELRGCNLLGGKYQYMGIPVKVNGDDPDLVGKTVATVNTFRVWSQDLENISWKNGKWEGSENEGRNTLQGFPAPENGIVNEVYSGELANSQNGSPPYYTKTEYKDGHQVTGTHAGGTLSGNSLLILSYKAHINIGVDGKSGTGLPSYNQSNGETVVDYRLKNIMTEVSASTGQTEKPPTKLTVEAVLDVGNNTGNQRISVSGGSYCMNGYAVDENGNIAQNATNISISDDPEKPTVLAFLGSDGEYHIIKVHAQLGVGKQSVSFVIQDAPVGIQVPDITFKANFAAVQYLENNAQLESSAYIAGEGDNRAYNTAEGNQANTTIGVVLSGGTNLTKAVNTRYIELDGSITYNVTYTNSGSKEIEKIYFYDLLPNNDDIRGSDFQGRVVLSGMDVTSKVSKESIDATSASGEEGTDSSAPVEATVYYSTVNHKDLYDIVSLFGATKDADGKIGKRDEQKVEEMLANQKLFNLLGKLTNGKFEYDSGFDKNTEMSKVTGLYVKVENLNEGQTIDMEIRVETDQNKANDWYKNIANSWIVGTETLPLTSNQVETQSLSRSISGVVWYDWNLDGIREDVEDVENGKKREPRLEGVTVTLFKKNENGEYEPCTRDVTGGEIRPISTDTEGRYSFEKLPQGDYIVAFFDIPAKGGTGKDFIDATLYQENGKNDATTNDGKKATSEIEKLLGSNEYAYYIHYGKESRDMELHSLEKMIDISLVNGVELYANQDLGLIVASHELPETGGKGTVPYTIGGLLTMWSGLLLLYKNKKRGKEDIASS